MTDTQTSTPRGTPPLRRIALGDLENEIATTRRVLERVPEEHFGWKPHEKSMSLGALAGHVANLFGWQTAMLEHDSFDLAAIPPEASAPPAGREALLDTFDRNVAGLRAALESADDAALSTTWTLRHGEHVVTSLPRVAAVRSAGISHVIHHRGQLSVYLRLLDVAVPPIYGPTADER